jgi:DNA replication and repair protein RecF
VEGVVLVVGPNGAGKTNLLESLHVGSQGFSPRTRADAQLIRFGASAARITLGGSRGASPVTLEVTLRSGAGKQARVNGASLPAAEQLRAEVTTLVFTPDRLAVVKGGPAVRRAYLDRTLGRLLPARAELPHAYTAAVVQRNAALRRVGLGLSSREALDPWTARVAELGADVVEARRETLALLTPAFAERAGELGLEDGLLEYVGEPPTPDELERRLERDLDRGATGVGPHLDDVLIGAGARDLRRYGSQGEQRLAVLSLLLAEADAIVEQRGTPPLLLLDDVLSELDPARRRALADRVAVRGQTLITSTTASAYPAAAAAVLEVTPGEVRRAA